MKKLSLKDWLEVGMYLALFGAVVFFGTSIFTELQNKLKEKVKKELEEIT